MFNCICSSDYEAPEFYNSKIVKAGEHIICCECDGDINPGDLYEHVTGMWDGRWSTFKTCLICVRIREDIYDPKCGFMHGGLRLAVRQAMED